MEESREIRHTGPGLEPCGRLPVLVDSGGWSRHHSGRLARSRLCACCWAPATYRGSAKRMRDPIQKERESCLNMTVTYNI